MECPECGNRENRVLRTAQIFDWIRRRRECSRCGRRYNTREKIEADELTRDDEVED